MRIAVVGGGINGVMTAWRLAELGHTVELFERDRLMHATSSASTKLLHGGLRYLEQGALHLVYESLHERTWWTSRAPHLAHPIRLALPVYRDAPRPRWMLSAGLTLYDILAGRHSFGRHHWHSARDVADMYPALRREGLVGAYTFFDAQMDDHALGLWAAEQARGAGVQIYEGTAVTHVDVSGTIIGHGIARTYQRVVNAAGPWAEHLLETSGIASRHHLDLVRGSHLLLPGTLNDGLLVQVPGERRICFILPYAGQILVGTTDVRQTLNEPITCSDAEREYLLGVYNYYFTDARRDEDIVSTFAGVRPLVASAADPSRATRESAIERTGRLITIFGGKWTTARALAARVATIAAQPSS